MERHCTSWEEYRQSYILLLDPLSTSTHYAEISIDVLEAQMPQRTGSRL